MQSLKDKVADKLSRLLADSPSPPHSVDVSPVARLENHQIRPTKYYQILMIIGAYNRFGHILGMRKSRDADPFIEVVFFVTDISLSMEDEFPSYKSRISSYVRSFLPSTHSSPDKSNRPKLLPTRSLPSRWKINSYFVKDKPLELSMDCKSDTESDSSDDVSKKNLGHMPQKNSKGHHEAKEASCLRDSSELLSTLTEKSVFISDNLFDFLQASLPNIVKGCKWDLLYSTTKHGISLQTLFRNSFSLSGPCLLIVGDMQGAIFGGLLDGPLKATPKRKYQGSNQTFVFTTVHGEPRLFRATGANRYYYMCVKDLLALGGGGGFALSLEEDLLRGTSGPCETFGNTCLAHSSDFEVKNVEVWGFTYSPRHLS